MHELSIMQSALDQVLEKARQAGASRVHAIRLRIGVLSGVVPDALQFAFEALADGTPAQGAQLLIEDVPARFWCAVCSHEFEETNTQYGGKFTGNKITFMTFHYIYIYIVMHCINLFV